MQNIKTRRYNPEHIFNRHGVMKTTKELGDDKKVTLFYLEKLSEDDSVVGYTKLKSYSEKKSKADAILGVSYKDSGSINKYAEFEVKDKKRFYQKVTGYLPVGHEQFVAIVQNRWLIFILLPILLAGILLLFNFCGRGSGDNPTQWIPDLEDFSDQTTSENTSTQRNIEIDGFTTLVMNKDTGKATVLLKNRKANPCYFTFSIYLDDGTLLYKSKLVPPGKELTQIELQPLDEGTYKGYVLIETNELETGNPMNTFNGAIEIISR